MLNILQADGIEQGINAARLLGHSTNVLLSSLLVDRVDLRPASLIPSAPAGR